MQKQIRSAIFAIALMAVWGNSAVACDFCLLSQGISPLDTLKGSGIKISERYTVLDQVFQGTGKKANPGAKEEYWTTELTGFYGITPEFMVLAVVPYKESKTTGELMPNPDGTIDLDQAERGNAGGLGDVSLLGRYTLLKQENPDSTNILAGLLGVKFATGKTNAKTTGGDEYLDSHLQPGSGSTDYLLGLSFAHSLERFSVSANLLGTIPTEGKFGNIKHRFGNALNYDAGAKYRIFPVTFTPLAPQVFLALGVNGEYREKEKVAGETDPDSGGTTTYVSPGVQLALVPHWVVDLSYQHAVYHQLEGTQLGETFRVVGGVTYLF